MSDTLTLFLVVFAAMSFVVAIVTLVIILIVFLHKRK